jgi:DNA-directed RNA polymerase specialized sigma24 family protein
MMWQRPRRPYLLSADALLLPVSSRRPKIESQPLRSDQGLSTMSTPPPAVTLLLQQIQTGQRDAAEALWRLYFPRLVRLARSHLAGLPRRAADEEDIALTAFDSFCRGAEQGRFPALHGRDELWKLLVTIAVRHAAEWRQRETRAKRGGGDVRGGSAVSAPEDSSAGGDPFDRVAGKTPEPGFEAAVAESCRRLLDLLGDEQLKRIAVWKMEGRTNQEIAERLGCVVETVERRLRLIRTLWQREMGDF